MSIKPSYRLLNLSDVVCPHCKQTVDTIPYPKAGRVTYLWCITLLMFTGICCFAPFMIDGCMDTEQRCSKCQEIVKYQRTTCCDMQQDLEEDSAI